MPLWVFAEILRKDLRVKEMALGETRKRMRIMSLTTAASMINDYFSGGADMTKSV